MRGCRRGVSPALLAYADMLLFLVLFTCMCAVSSYASAGMPIRFYVSGQCGFADWAGVTVIEPQYKDCGEFSDGLAAVQIGSRWGYIDSDGKLTIKAQFATAEAFSERLAFVELATGQKAVIGTNGTVLFEADYYEHGRFLEGVAPVHPVMHWHCGLGEERREYSGTHPPRECPVDQAWPTDHYWGYIDRTGKMVIPAQFLLAHEFHDGLARERDGFIDHNGNEVIHTEVMGATDFSEGEAAVEEDDKWGYIDTHGTYIVRPVYEAAEAMSDGRGLVKSDGKYGFVDASGTPVIVAQFDGALSFSNGLAAVRIGEKWGYIDRSGEVAIPFQFDSAESFQNGQAVVTTGGEVTLINPTGTRLKSRPPSLGQIFRELQAFEVKSLHQGVPAEGPLDLITPLMAIYKEQLRELVTNKIIALKDQDSKAIKTSLDRELGRAGIRRSSKDTSEARPYGLIDELEVFRPAEQPTLFVVLFHLKLATGIDSSLSVYRLGDGQPIFRADHNDYDKTEMDAYHIATPEFTHADDQKSFLMLLASQSGYAGNGSYALRVELLRFDQSLRHESILEKTYYGKGHQIAIEPKGFRLEILSGESDSYRAGYRVYPYRYRIGAPSGVERIVPIAFDAHDFVEEWGSLAWEEAAKWSASAQSEKLRSWHDRYRDADGYFGGDSREHNPAAELYGRLSILRPARTATRFSMWSNV